MLSFASPSWSVMSPREWQRKAFATISEYYAGGGISGIVSAVMRSGKSILIDEICATANLENNEYIVVSTSSQRLTNDLFTSVSRRCASRSVGIWYAGRKRLGQITICCDDSLEQLSEKLKAIGKTVLLWVADECHKTQSDTVIKAVRILSPLNSIGFTATPFRSCPKQTISLFRRLIYRYSVADAIKDKVIVPWKIENWYGEDRELDESCEQMIRKFGAGPGLVNASTINDAEEYAGYLTKRNIPARAIHSGHDMREQNRILDMVKHGELRCAIHVNTLAEGVTLPWLYWLCMRRQVSARVRFIQELGRILGAHPGKEYATFLDPHDLFGSFNLSYAEALGEAGEEPEVELSLDPKENAERIANLDPALSLALIESVVRTLVVACDVNGILVARRPIKKVDRLKPSNREQHAVMAMGIRKVNDLASDGWRACLNEIAKRPDMLRFGFAAELQLALNSIYKAQRWPELGSDGLISGMPEEKKYETPLVADKHGQFQVEWGRL